MKKVSTATAGQLELRRSGLVLHLAALAGANAASVAALYLGQVLAQSIAEEFPTSAASLSLIPGATLAGYAVGASVTAFNLAGKTKLSVPAHLGLLAAALCSAGLAPTATALAVASLAVGAGAAVAQRLLAAAGSLGGAAQGGLFIGKTICAALTAILGTRLAGDVLAQLIGWRVTFVLAGVVVAWFGILNYWVRAIGEPLRLIPSTASATSSGLVGPLWRRSTLLRWAVFQHGAMFAAYNLAWMTILVEVPALERAPVVIVGCGTGIVMALLSGYCVDRLVGRDLARYGAGAVAVATIFLLPIAYSSVPGAARALILLPGMALLDGGLQVALVANQARVQSLSPDTRPRLAALLTVCGSLSGAAGAGLGYGLWQHFGWQAAIGLAASLGLLTFISATLAGSRQLNRTAVADRSNFMVQAAILHPTILHGWRRLASPMSLRRQVRTA